MANYNSFEKLVAKSLEKAPWIRDLVRFVYKRSVYLLYKKWNFDFELESGFIVKTPYNLIQTDAPEKEDLFFGYYDKSPWNKSMSKAIFHSHDGNNSKIKIKLFDFKKNKAIVLAETETWNYQQGAMVQWIDDDHIVYNDIVRESWLGSIKLNVNNGKESRFDLPIQCVSNSGKVAISLNYSRLMWLRPDYGYQQNFDNFQRDQQYDTDGLWAIDLESGKSALIVSLERLTKISPQESMSNANHKVNHVIYSPFDTHIVFLHRWISKTGKYSRLYVADRNGENLKILLDERMISHYSWRNDTDLIAWARYEGIDGYYLINITSGLIKALNREINLYGDGHPTFNMDYNNIFVSDSYPDKSRIRYLFTSDLDGQLQNIGRFFSPWAFENEERCDLHPRWAPNGNLLSIDSVHSGKRMTYFILNENGYKVLSENK